MALNPSVQLAPNIIGPSAEYPFGSSKNETAPGDLDGTPYNALRADDIFGSQQALLDAASITPSGVPDEVGASQYLQAIQFLISAGAVSSFTDLSDTPGALVADNYLQVNAGGTALVFKTQAEIAGPYTLLTDTPASLVALNYQRVNAGGTALENRTPAQTASELQILIDHGALVGLGDDDHQIYFLADGSRIATGDITIDKTAPKLILIDDGGTDNGQISFRTSAGGEQVRFQRADNNAYVKIVAQDANIALDLDAKRIQGLKDPAVAQDAATKAYVDVGDSDEDAKENFGDVPGMSLVSKLKPVSFKWKPKANDELDVDKGFTMYGFKALGMGNTDRNLTRKIDRGPNVKRGIRRGQLDAVFAQALQELNLRLKALETV